MRGVTSEYQHGRVILCIYTQYIVSCILSIIQDNVACMLFSIKRSTLAHHGQHARTCGRVSKLTNQIALCIMISQSKVFNCSSSSSHGPQCPVTKSSVLVCWLGHESLQAQCLKLVTQLWSHGVAADLVYENQELDSLEDIQVVHTTCYMWYQTLEGEKLVYRCRMGIGRKVLYFHDGLHEEPTKTFGSKHKFRRAVCYA